MPKACLQWLDPNTIARKPALTGSFQAHCSAFQKKQDANKNQKGYPCANSRYQGFVTGLVSNEK
jgi:hypothetical protein